MRLFWLILGAVAVLSGASAAQAQTPPVPVTRQQRLSSVQAAIIYQLTRYITQDVSQDNERIICIYRDTALGEELQHLLAKKTNGAHLRVRNADTLSGNCDVLYLPPQQAGDFTMATIAYKNRPVLFLSGASGFIDTGGMVSMVDREGSIAIELNMQSLKAANFDVNPSLIDIATRVIK